MGDFAPEDGPLVQQIALSGACGGRVSANCKPQLAPSGKGVGGWVLVAGFFSGWGVGGSVGIAGFLAFLIQWVR